MPDKDIQDFDTIASADGADYALVIDTSDTTDDPGGSLKKVLLSGNGAGMAFSGAHAYRSADTTGVNATGGYTLGFDTEAYDTGGWHDTVTNNSRMTVPSGVSYVEIYVTARMGAVVVTDRVLLDVTKNGSSLTPAASDIQKPADNEVAICQVHVPRLAVTPGDYIEAVFYSQADTSVTISLSCSFFIKSVA